MEKKIAILGCGWLGLPLAKSLLAYGYKVNGSTTSTEKLKELQSAGITAYHLNFDPEARGSLISEFFDTEILILNIPPARRTDVIEWYTAQIHAIITQVKESSVKKVIFTSSTSVYPSVNGTVSEDDILVPDKSSGVALLKVEDMLRQETAFETTVLRLAGLMGPGRHPGRFLAGKKNVANPDAPVNLIHLEDCIGIIKEIIHLEVWGEIFNCCADEHPSRRDFYSLAAKNLGLEPPEFNEHAGGDFKIVDNRKLRNQLNYYFRFSDPLNALKTDF